MCSFIYPSLQKLSGDLLWSRPAFPILFSLKRHHLFIDLVLKTEIKSTLSQGCLLSSLLFPGPYFLWEIKEYISTREYQFLDSCRGVCDVRTKTYSR